MGFSAYRAWNTGMSSLDPNTIELTKVWSRSLMCRRLHKQPSLVVTLRSLLQQGATLYTIQLGLNLIWMPLFFGLKRPIEATVDIVALTGVTGYLTYIWSQVDPVAAWGIVPYVGWLSFATYLSVSGDLTRLVLKKC